MSLTTKMCITYYKNPDDGVEDLLLLDAFMYAHDELEFEDDRIATDHIMGEY